MKNYIIIGNGIAGVSAAQTIRQHDSESPIHIFSDEAYPFYARIRLPQIVSGQAKPEKLSELVQKQATPQKATDVIKNIYAFEFLDLKIKDAVEESDLETALINHLQEFIDPRLALRGDEPGLL